MANKTVTVRPSGGTYASLQAAITGEALANADLTASGLNGILTIFIEGDWSGGADTAAVDITGFTVDSTHYVNIITDSANKTGTSRSATKYRLETSGQSINIRNAYTRINGIQIKGNSNHGSLRFFSDGSTTTGCIVDSCLLYDNGSVSIEFHTGANGNLVRNTNIIGSYWEAVKSLTGAAAYSNSIYNCSFTGRYGVYVYGTDTIVAKNTYVNATSGDAWNDTTDSGTLTLTSCYSDDGTHSTSSAAFSTSNFANVNSNSEDLSLVSGSSLIGAGTDLRSDPVWPFDYDILGNTRGASWDVGADEFVAAGGLSIPVAMHHRRMQGVS